METVMNSIGYPPIGAALEQAFGSYEKPVLGEAINGLFPVRELGLFPAKSISPVAEHVRIGSVLERFHHIQPAGETLIGRP